MRDFWDEFNASITNIKELRITNVLDVLNVTLAPLAFPVREDGSDVRSCPLCKNGELSLKLGRYGAFVGCSNYPECKYTRQLGTDTGEENEAIQSDEPVVLGVDSQTGKEISLRKGRFGPYVQLGESKGDKRAGLPKEWKAENVTLDKALALLSLPREIGIHPETGKVITATIGRYGPYLTHDGKSAPLLYADEVFDIGINRAVTVLAEKRENKTTQARTTSAALATLGEHPDGGPVTVRNGRYGPYVNWGKINATLPKEKEPISVTLSEALELISAKESSKKGTGKTSRKKGTTKRASSKGKET